MEELRYKLIERMTDNLPVLRKKLGLTQDDLAQLIDSTRYTVMLLETKKRPMKWTTFLSLVLLFEMNEDTAPLLRVLGIYTDELKSLLCLQKEASVTDEIDLTL